MKTQGTTILVFEHRDVEWLAVFIIALMLRTKERENAGVNTGHPVNRRLAEERKSIVSAKKASRDALHWKDTKLLKLVIKALGDVKIDLEREEFVGRKHFFRNFIANSYLKKTIDADFKSLDQYLRDLQQKLLQYTPTKLSKDLMVEWMSTSAAVFLETIFKLNNPARVGVDYADTGVLNLRLEEKLPAEAAVSSASTKVPGTVDTGESFWDRLANARVTSIDSRTGVHSDLNFGADFKKHLGF